jgi:hypothetical protein
MVVDQLIAETAEGVTAPRRQVQQVEERPIAFRPVSELTVPKELAQAGPTAGDGARSAIGD